MISLHTPLATWGWYAAVPSILVYIQFHMTTRKARLGLQPEGLPLMYKNMIHSIPIVLCPGEYY